MGTDSLTNTNHSIIDVQNCKISSFLQDGKKTDFFYAYSPHISSTQEYINKVHSLGFDNYPIAPINDGIFFIERLIGCKISTVDNQTGSFFHTWCDAVVHKPDDIFGFKTDIENNAVWTEYLEAVTDYYGNSLKPERLPLAFPGFNLLDAACNVCGAENLLEFMYEAENAVEYLLDLITDTQIQVYTLLQARGIKMCNSFGFPCVYCNDLQMGVISPAMIERFLLPRYFRAADAVGGMILVLNCPDVSLAELVLKQESIIGCGFDKRIPLESIDRILGDKLFIIGNYVYNPDVDHPMEIDGIWCNPIVQSYSRELTEVYSRLHENHSFLITIERYTLDEIVRTRKELQKQGD